MKQMWQIWKKLLQLGVKYHFLYFDVRLKFDD